MFLARIVQRQAQHLKQLRLQLRADLAVMEAEAVEAEAQVLPAVLGELLRF
jgi:hypothetical protein